MEKPIGDQFADGLTEGYLSAENDKLRSTIERQADLTSSNTLLHNLITNRDDTIVAQRAMLDRAHEDNVKLRGEVDRLTAENNGLRTIADARTDALIIAVREREESAAEIERLTRELSNLTSEYRALLEAHDSNVLANEALREQVQILEAELRVTKALAIHFRGYETSTP